ncbi:hypothetical protein [uncultured Tenacibaculum sp.]|uniref:hypothetical protein n=1 Tax=uncultured Tenacibaculum sp. TaxID=174713 RepID=UPI00260965B7|nr:hypothetical protein [uncultured Tenacibaculum sp.]
MKNQFLNLGKTLNKVEQQEIYGGKPSERRCDRLLRRAERYLDNGNLNGADRVLDTYDRIC